MDALKAYRYYMAIKLHFTNEKFNVFENRGRINCSRETFEKRNDRSLFEIVSKRYKTDKELVQFYASNFMYGNNTPVYNIEESEVNLQEWMKRRQMITKLFSDDLHSILNNQSEENKTDIFNFETSEIPSILKLYLGNKIKIETVSILNDIRPFDFDKINSSLKLLLSDKLLLIRKSSGFVKYDLQKIKTAYESIIEEYQFERIDASVS